MNPIALAGGWGLVKGLVAGRSSARRSNHLGAYLAGPMVEEAMFRLPQLHPALSSAAFAAVHLSGPMVKSDPGFSAFRFAEVFAGGLLYDQAFKRYGFLGAVGAHCFHNVACTLGALISPRAGFGPLGRYSKHTRVTRPHRRPRAKTTRPSLRK